MARKKPRSYFEPWCVTKSTGHGKEPIVEGLPAEVGERLLDAWGRMDRDADWIIWGSKMAQPAICKNLDGKAAVIDDSRIIAIRRTLGLPSGAPKHEDMAKRIAACVNGCAGIADPEKFVADIRALLLGYAKGECEDPRQDNRVVSLLGRCIPPEEMDKFNDENET